MGRDISEVYKKYFREGLLTQNKDNDGAPTLEYPIDITKKNHIRIVARQYNHPQIQSPAALTAIQDITKKLTGQAKDFVLNTISEGTSDLVGEEARDYIENKATEIKDYFSNMETAKQIKSTFSEIADVIEKTIGSASKLDGTFFTFYTYIPGDLSDSASATWGDDFNTDRGRAEIKKLLDYGSGKFEGLGKLGSLLTKASGGDIVGYGLYKAGKSMVPANTAIFKASDSPSLTIEVKFTPKNENEAKIMLDTVRLFRYGTRPTLAPGATFFDYPPLYDITLCPKNSDEAVTKSSYQRYPPMYLSSCDAVKSSGNAISTFYDGGIPSDVVMRLTFNAAVINYNGAPWESGYK